MGRGLVTRQLEAHQTIRGEGLASRQSSKRTLVEEQADTRTGTVDQTNRNRELDGPQDRVREDEVRNNGPAEPECRTQDQAAVVE